jgi:hypothetical protein
MTGIRSLTLFRLLVPKTELSVALPDGLSYFTLNRKIQKIQLLNLIEEEEEEEEEEERRRRRKRRRSFVYEAVVNCSVVPEVAEKLSLVSESYNVL